VEISMRETKTAKFLFALNHTDKITKVALGKLSGANLLTGQSVARTLTLAPLDVAVVQLK
jgi:beta-galactosidase GanA